MDRYIEHEINGKIYTLHFSIAVMFDMIDKFKNTGAVFDILGGSNKEAFETLRWLTLQLTRDGELLRREKGYEPQSFLSEADLSFRMPPFEYIALREAVMKAISLGYQADLTNENAEIDLGLQELREKKTESVESGQNSTTSP